MRSVSEFDHQFNWRAYSRWQNPPTLHEEDGCLKCHAAHREENVFEPECRVCVMFRCGNCGGRGYTDAENAVECLVCHGVGRTD